MKTDSYNPSTLEVDLANIIESFKEELSQRLNNRKITAIEHRLDMDNPTLYFHIEDDDGDKHLIIVKLIQKPDDLI